MNYYEILKVAKNATSEEIKNSYKQLVKKYHPDLYVGDKGFAEQKIKEINEAYDILSNPETKLEYDAYLNPKPAETYYASEQNLKSNGYTENQNISNDSEPKWSFTRFLADKFNLLDKKKQLQVFILIFVCILSLFLINLIQVQHYLKNQNTVSNENNISNNLKDDTFIDYDIDNENNDFYDENQFEALDNLLYDLLDKYEESIYNAFNSYENTEDTT